MNFDTSVRITLYHEFARTGRSPSADALASLLNRPVESIRESLERLAKGKAIVLQPESREVLMANPFSAVATSYAVRAGQRSFFGACAWDALGILAMLHEDGVVESSCPCCGEAMALEIIQGIPRNPAGIVHFALPAKRWWESIVFT